MYVYNGSVMDGRCHISAISLVFFFFVSKYMRLFATASEKNDVRSRLLVIDIGCFARRLHRKEKKDNNNFVKTSWFLVIALILFSYPHSHTAIPQSCFIGENISLIRDDK